MVLEEPGKALTLKEVDQPSPSGRQVLINISVCGVCRTDLHILDGELEDPDLPLIPGHQIVGTVEETGEEVSGFKKGDKVGVPWLGKTCGQCEFCKDGRETCAIMPCLPAMTLMGDSPNLPSPMSSTAFLFPKTIPTYRQLLCSVPV